MNLSTPKTDRSRRAIALPGFVTSALREHKARREAQIAKNEKWDDNGLVFVTRSGKPISARNVVRFFKDQLAEAGLPDIRFHDLRHTAASLLLERNIHPKVVQELLGHSTATLTLDTYSHLLPSMQKQVAQSMDDLVDQE